MIDDDFGEGVDDDMHAADMRRIASKLGKDGFRIGKASEEEALMQQGFDAGFTPGIKLGIACGKLYGQCAAVVGTGSNLHLAALQELLYEIVPEEEAVGEDLRLRLRDTVLSISSDLSNQWAAFEETLRTLE